MKSKKALILAIIFTLLTSIFAMSDDGANEPKVEKKEILSKVSQVDIPNTTEEAKSIDAVNDRLGFDTGMTKTELENFKTQYTKKAEELGILDYPIVSPKSYFEHKVNLNAVNELKELGLFFNKDPFTPEEGFAYKITHSDIIVIGAIDSVEYFYNTEAEEWKAKPHILSRYFVKVEKILKGSEYYNKFPETLTYFSSNGNFLTSGDYKPKIGQKHIFFFQKISRGIVFDNDLSKMRFSSLRIVNDKIYRLNLKEEFMKSFDEVLTLIDKFIEINDINNFYKKEYIKEDNNEK